VAPILAGMIIAIFAGAQGSWLIVRRSIWLPGLLVFCAVALPWYVLVQLRNPQFFRVFILEHNLARFGTNMFHHPEPFWYYVPVSALGWLPWAVFVLSAIFLAVRRLRTSHSDSLNTFLLVWILVIVVFFSISQSKLPGYILPAFAPGVLLLVNHLWQGNFSKVHRLPAILHGFCGGGLIFAALALRYTLLQHKLVWNSGLIAPAIVSMLVAAAIVFVVSKAGLGALRVATLIPAVLALAIAVRFGSLPLNEMLSARAVSDALARVSPRNVPVAAVLISREVEFGLQFYRNQFIPRYELHQAPSGEHLVIARAGFQEALARDIPGRKVVKLGSYPEQNLEFFYVTAR